MTLFYKFLSDDIRRIIEEYHSEHEKDSYIASEDENYVLEVDDSVAE